ncbi:cupin domain-containing protein [Paenibacillus humicola]|uniref:cupin domain-containing protein n=1 Tax=Paenibacillus humicola TaxID=3110540 RepID=UPI00237B7775|nr:cupin domain-containing protein [Paenibacillus humicola]
MRQTEAKIWRFQDDGTIPNSGLPVVLYPGALTEEAESIERIFNLNNWRNSWTNGIYSFHHYHSDAHEVLGIVRGYAVVQLGGERGETVKLQKGDVVILPAGTGHKRLSASGDLLVAGAYPDGMSCNLRKGAEGERPRALEEIRAVPLPSTDPVYGRNGPLMRLWTTQELASF